MSPHGYSWFDGLLRNPRSGVQTPQVLGYSGMRVALNPQSGFKPLRDGVILRGRGLGSHMSNQGILWRIFPGETGLKTIRPTWDRTPGVGQLPNRLVTNSPHSPCQLSAEGGTWWQDSSNYRKGASLGRGASRHKNLQVARLMRGAVGGERPCLRFHGS